MDLPLSLLFIAFLVPLLIFCILAVANVYHVVVFGAFDSRNTLAVLLFVGASVLLLAGTALYLFSVDWTATATLPLPALALPEW